MDSYDSESRRIFQHFSRSTRSAYLCTAPISKIQLKFVKLFAKLNIEYSISCIFSLNFAILKPNFYKILSEFRQNFQKMVKSVERVMRFCKKLTKFPENYSKISGISENIEFFDWKIQFGPYLQVRRWQIWDFDSFRTGCSATESLWTKDKDQ